MEERRKAPRMRVLKTGKIVLSEKTPGIPCTVRNLSSGGACVQTDNHYGIPESFVLVVDGVSHPCRVIWRSTLKIGVAFDPTTDTRHAA